jgi:hypothetical protein
VGAVLFFQPPPHVGLVGEVRESLGTLRYSDVLRHMPYGQPWRITTVSSCETVEMGVYCALCDPEKDRQDREKDSPLGIETTMLPQVELLRRK